MTANATHTGALLWATESSFGELSTTFDRRLPVTGELNDIMSGLSQERHDPAWTQQYANDGAQSQKLLQGGTFSITAPLTGFGSTSAGALAATEQSRYLGYVVGNSDVTQDGGTVNAPTSATQFSLTGCTVLAGGIIAVGTLGDGDGEAQCYAVNNNSTITVLNALAGTPVGAQVVRVAQMIYPSESPTSTSVQSLRMQVQTSDQRANIYGVCPTSLAFSGLNTGEVPTYTVGHSCAAWEKESASTFPTTVSTDNFGPAVVAAGTLFMNTVGTTTRVLIDYRDIQINIDLQTVPLFGPGAPRTYQGQVGCRRTRCKARLQFTVDAETAGTDTWGDAWNVADLSQSFRHAMLTLSPADGQQVAFYFPKLKFVGARPTQHSRNGLNAVTVMFEALTGGTTTNALTLSNWRLGTL
jgi:hypothetical protein